MPHSIGRIRGDWGTFGDFKRYTIRYKGGILYNEAVVPTRIRAESTPLPYRFG